MKIYNKWFVVGGKPRKYAGDPPEFRYWIERRYLQVLCGSSAYELTLGSHGYFGPFVSVYLHHEGSRHPGRVSFEIGFNWCGKPRRRIKTALRWIKEMVHA
jgi:hypothetical protein